jgi:polysaccharide pyruvyl transferase WcaK-like protein
MKTLGLAPRPWKKGPDVVKLFADLSKRIHGMGYIPFFIGMDRQEDAPLIQQIAKVSGGHVPDLKGLRSPMDIASRIQRMEAVVAMRLHAGVLAATVGIPSLMIAYDPKVSAFAKLLGAAEAVPLEGLTAERLAEQVQAFLKNRDRHAEAVVRRKDELVKLAAQNVELLKSAVR